MLNPLKRVQIPRSVLSVGISPTDNGLPSLNASSIVFNISMAASARCFLTSTCHGVLPLHAIAHTRTRSPQAFTLGTCCILEENESSPTAMSQHLTDLHKDLCSNASIILLFWFLSRVSIKAHILYISQLDLKSIKSNTESQGSH